MHAKPDISKIHFIGTSHIAKQSINEVKNYVEEHKPDIVAVELDSERLKALLANKRDRISLKNIGIVRKIGFVGFLFAYIASFVQKKLGNKVKTPAGSDMLTAVKLAKEHNLKIALIDQNVNVTLKKLSQEMKFKDKMRIFFDLLKAFFLGDSGANELGLKNIDLRKVPQDELVEKVIGKTKERYPSLYKVLALTFHVFLVLCNEVLKYKCSNQKNCLCKGF
jgi:pheromone shutdown protein TraB